MNVLRDVAGAPQLALVLDIDALERSARARVDRVMLLALAALGRARVELVLAARTEHERALLLQRAHTWGHVELGPDGSVALTRKRANVVVLDGATMHPPSRYDVRRIALLAVTVVDIVE